MDARALLRKESIVVRRHLPLFVVLLVVLPGTFVLGTAMYQQTLPEDVPVGIAPAEAETSDDDLAIIRGGVTFFATPVEYDDPERARADLTREAVYLVIEVPADLTDAGSDATFTLVSDQHFAPFREPANITEMAMADRLDRTLAADVDVDHERVGPPRDLSAFLIPAGLLVYVAGVGLLYLPHQLRRERAVMDRLRTTSRLEVVAGVKLAFHAALLAVPLAVMAAATRVLGYDVAVLAPATLLVSGLTFVALAALGMAVAFLTGLRRGALAVNAGLLAVVLATSSLIYPAGFFSSIGGVATRFVPTHYAMVMLRMATLRDASTGLYPEYLAYLVVTAVLAVIALQVGIVRYRRSR